MNEEATGPNFCKTCGMQTTTRPTGKFHEQTGQPILESVCPTMLCGHIGFKHKYSVTHGPLEVCTHCGYSKKALHLCDIER